MFWTVDILFHEILVQSLLYQCHLHRRDMRLEKYHLFDLLQISNLSTLLPIQGMGFQKYTKNVLIMRLLGVVTVFWTRILILIL